MIPARGRKLELVALLLKNLKLICLDPREGTELELIELTANDGLQYVWHFVSRVAGLAAS